MLNNLYPSPQGKMTNATLDLQHQIFGNIIHSAAMKLSKLGL